MVGFSLEALHPSSKPTVYIPLYRYPIQELEEQTWILTVGFTIFIDSLHVVLNHLHLKSAHGCDFTYLVIKDGVKVNENILK